MLNFILSNICLGKKESTNTYKPNTDENKLILKIVTYLINDLIGFMGENYVLYSKY